MRQLFRLALLTTAAALWGCDSWRTLNHDAFLVPGNHELGAFGEYDRAVQALSIKSETGRGYYSFTVAGAPGWRFLVIDGNDASLTANSLSAEFARGVELFKRAQAKNAATVWWSGGVSQDQLDWLETELDASQAAGESVVVFSHFPLGGTIGYDLWNADNVHTLFSRYDHIAGFFGGHYHQPYAVSGSPVPQIGVPSLLGRSHSGEWGHRNRVCGRARQMGRPASQARRVGRPAQLAEAFA